MKLPSDRTFWFKSCQGHTRVKTRSKYQFDPSEKFIIFHKNSKQWVFTMGKIGRLVPQLRRSWFKTTLPPERYQNRPVSSILFRYFLRFFNLSSSRLILKRLRSFHPRSLWWWIRGSSQFHQPEGVQNDEMSWNDIFELFYVTRI